MNTANLALRFALEFAALGGFGFLAWHSAEGFWRVVAAAAIVILIATIWGVFAVPDDPSRSGSAPVPIPGVFRLSLELAVLLGGALAFYLVGWTLPGVGLALLICVHYAFSLERFIWLMQQ